MLKQTVSVQSYSGDGSYGPVYSAAVAVACNIDTRRRMVRNANGDEVVSEATLFVHPDDAAPFVPESLLSISGRQSRVMAVNPKTFRSGTFAVEVACS